MWELAVPVLIAVIAILVIGLLFARLYKRSTRDEAYVRTVIPQLKAAGACGIVEYPISKIID